MLFQILKRLIGLKPVDLAPGRDWSIDVVGESKFQDNLRALKGSYEHDLKVTAILVREPSNTNDANAVRVEIGGKQVGYLTREMAAQYKLKEAGRCSAKIVGGFLLDNGDIAHFGVKLNLSWPRKPRA